MSIVQYTQKCATQDPASFEDAWDFLGSLSLSAAAATLGPLQIPPREQLKIVVRVNGLSSAEIPALRFNADATAANYATRWISISTASTPAITQTNTTGSAQILLRNVASSFALSAIADLMNPAAVRKVIQIGNAAEIQTAGAVPSLELGWGIWHNTANYITQVQLRTNVGGTLNSGSGFWIWGKNF
jgi:hypothetical protein